MPLYNLPPMIPPSGPGLGASEMDTVEWQDKITAFLGGLGSTLEELGDAYVAVENQLNDGVVGRGKLSFDIQVDLSNASTVFDATVQYRSTGAPTNSPVPATFQALIQNDASVSYLISWNYTQSTTTGGKIADGFAIFVRNADATPTLSDGHFTSRARETTTGSYSTFFQVDGCSQDKIISFGVAAYRKSDRGYEMGSIIGSTSAPDWQGVTQGTPNYLGKVSGRKIHSFSFQAAGLQATDPTVRIQQDDAVLYSSTSAAALDAIRSYSLSVFDLNSETIEFSQSYDVYAWQAEAHNLRTKLNTITGVAKMCVVMGLSRPFRNRLTNLPRFTQIVNSAARTWGKQQTVSGFLTGQTYIASVYLGINSIDNGNFQARIANVVTLMAATAVGNPVGSVTRYEASFTASATSLTIQLLNANSTAATATWWEAWINSGATILPTGTNKVSNGDFTDGFTSWIDAGGGPSAGDTVATSQIYRGLSAALVQKGASRQCFENDGFHELTAYILVGTHNVGEGNGIQVFSGPTSSAQIAKLTVQTQDLEIQGVSGQGWQPTWSPGLPTNNPSPSSTTIVSRDTGEEIVEFTWTYTQPALENDNKLADGFIFYVASGTATDASSAPIGAFLIDVDKRSFVMQAPYQQSWSASIASFRRSASGIERGPAQTSAAAPDWIGIAGSQQIITGGILTSAITTALLSSACVTTLKVLADNITTGLRQAVNSQSVSVSAASGNFSHQHRENQTTAYTQSALTTASLTGGLASLDTVTYSHSIGKVPLYIAYTGGNHLLVPKNATTAQIIVDVASVTQNSQIGSVVVAYW